MSSKEKKYDVIVIGSGSGAGVVEASLYQGWKVAQVDRGPLGGTCLNVGCIPSKMLIAVADKVMEIGAGEKLGVHGESKDVDFEFIMERMRRSIGQTREHIREAVHHTEHLDFYEQEGHFIDAHTLQVGGRRISAEKIFIASGARPLIPPIDGLDKVEYLTNETLLELGHRPESLVIVGGGYIGCEYGHFFAAMGTEVTIVTRSQRLVPEEEPEISQVLQTKMAQRMEIHTDTEVVSIRQEGGLYRIVGSTRATPEKREFAGQKVLIAAGRRSNADLLRAAKGGIEMDPKGYIRVDEYLQTNRDQVWAIGDANGKYMFTHVANREAAVAWHNSIQAEKVKMDYSAVPHAVFTHPQIASVGLTEAQAKERHDILVGRAKYSQVAMGEAIMETDGLAKAVVDRESQKILGFHIVGPHAAMLIQEVVDVMANGLPVSHLYHGLHIHPAMSELIVSALTQLREPDTYIASR